VGKGKIHANFDQTGILKYKKPPHSLSTKIDCDNLTPCFITDIGYIKR
jgi:hypothetical protein